MKIFLFVCIFIMSFTTTHAQEITTKGKIVDEFNSPVPYASVVFKNDTSADTVFGVLSEGLCIFIKPLIPIVIVNSLGF